MPYTTINSGDYITSSWANANVRDQVVTPFASSASRTSSITVPVAGMVSALTTNTATEGIYEYNSAGQWRAPWNLSWGVVALDNLTTSENVTATSFSDVNGFVTSSFTPVNRRYYRVTLSVTAKQVLQSASNTLSLQIVSTAAAANIGKQIDQTLQTTDYQSAIATFWINNTATAATTYKVQAKTSGGTAVLDGVTYNCAVIVEDMGPSGAPS
jgi:hypothetical protein